MGTLSPSELGWRLQLVRGAIWQEAATSGDAYADLLRGLPAKPGRPGAAGLWRSTTGAWVCADADLGRHVLTDERFGVRRADGTKPHLQILPVDEAGLGLEAADQRRIARVMEPLFSRETRVREHAEALLDGLGSAFDVITGYAEPLARRVLAEVLGWDADPAALAPLALVPDAMLTPPTLDQALALTAACRRLRGTPTRAGEDDVLAGKVAGSVLFLATAPTLLGNAVRSGEPYAVDQALRHYPPLRLLPRVAHRDVVLGDVLLEEGSEIVVRVTVPDGADLPEADRRYAMMLPLLRSTVTAGLAALHERCPRPLVHTTHWHARSPVTARLARLEVTG
ncbi:hypothetical protein [Prauserella flavalba]|uniref:Cytochrome P450 n=1 Tax=Prauserella flavalba TaxID=1477506 RepID=A0A318LV69_9PSEU|nr:hypothetical protein [Prauserella flavalba]PXY36307.1 hypothetical protein BA062_12890 [Prauserella flavalba]